MKNRSLVLLSGEKTSIPEAEAKALFLAYDAEATFSSPEERLLVVESSVDPVRVSRRVAFARRVGLLLSSPSEAFETVRNRRVRYQSFHIGDGPVQETAVSKLLEGLEATVDLENPDFEFSNVVGRKEYFMLSTPGQMRQAWARRRPRKRPFFHPSAIFPKLSRALVNLTRCREGDTFLDPLAGTGSLPIEANEVGLFPLAIDRSKRMACGALANMKAFGQPWPDVIRADAFQPPVVRVDGIATDVPYGRASSTGGRSPGAVIDLVMRKFPELLKPGGRLVVMHPSQVPLEARGGTKVEGEHYIYIHKKLTRAITILRKT